MKLNRQQLPLLATTLVCIALYLGAGLKFPAFWTLRVFVNFLGDNAFLGIVGIGITFVILTGGIDLSVGAVVGCTSIAVASLVQKGGFHPVAAICMLLAAGTLLGIAHGAVIQKFGLPPFLVTLAGLFLCRGVGLWISSESVQIAHPFFRTMAGWKIPLTQKLNLPFQASLFLILLIVCIYVAKFTRFGRTAYAIGGNEASANLMGLPVAKTKIGVYALSGFCAALGGVVFAAYTSSGNAIAGTGLELDAIATVVMGGTLLTGGYGSVFGTLLGLLIFAIIQTSITFQGTLSSWWGKIVTGALLLAFILLQRALQKVRD
jgi:simple sugar transport system permease protein